MTDKRKYLGNQEGKGALYNKRARRNDADGSIDPTYGQRGAFPGLDGPNGDDEFFYGPASDGLEYLRMVR